MKVLGDNAYFVRNSFLETGVQPNKDVFPCQRAPLFRSLNLRVLSHQDITPVAIARVRALGANYTLVKHQGWLAKSVPQLIDSLKNRWSAQQLVFQFTPARKIKQHDPEKDRQNALPGHSRQRQHNP